MALKVLLVDPDEEWLFSAKEYLQNIFYEVDIVNNGKDAQLSLYNNKYFAVVMNIETKDHPGVQVLRFIKTNHPSQKVVMVMPRNAVAPSGNENKKDDGPEFSEEDLKKYGVVDILMKPFSFDDMKDMLEGHQNITEMITSIPKRKDLGPEEEVAMEDDKFTKVKIDEFYTSQPVLFDLFIKLSSGRYVKILHAGDKMSHERIDKYRNEKNVEYLYFQKCDLSKYVKFNNYVASKYIESKNAKPETKVKFLHNVAEKYLEEAFIEGMKPQIIDQGREVAANVYNLVENEKNLYKLLRDYQEFDPNAYSHTFLVTLFTTSIIKQFEWQSKTTIETTALACLLHDIGKIKFPKEMLEKRPDQMSEQELEEYKKHPEYGVEMLKGNRLVTNSVKQIILQHHEHFDGTGFPNGKKGAKILTLANIVCLANDFVHLIVELDKRPVDALKVFLSEKRDWLPRYNSMIVECLIKAFTDPEKIKKDYILPSNSKMVPSKKAS